MHAATSFVWLGACLIGDRVLGRASMQVLGVFKREAQLAMGVDKKTQSRGEMGSLSAPVRGRGTQQVSQASGLFYLMLEQEAW